VCKMCACGACETVVKKGRTEQNRQVQNVGANLMGWFKVRVGRVVVTGACAKE